MVRTMGGHTSLGSLGHPTQQVGHEVGTREPMNSEQLDSQRGDDFTRIDRADTVLFAVA